MPAVDVRAGVPPAVETFRFVVPARLEYRDAARQFIAFVCAQTGKKLGLGDELIHRVISAFVEAFNNAVIHGYKGRAIGPVEVELEVTPARLTLRIIDEGVGFQPDRVPTPDLDLLPEGGMGLFIMKSFMDEVRYTHLDGKNVLEMIKNLPAGGPIGAPDA